MCMMILRPQQVQPPQKNYSPLLMNIGPVETGDEKFGNAWLHVLETPVY